MRIKTTLLLATAALALILFVTAEQMDLFRKLFEEKAPAFPQLTVADLEALEIENGTGTIRLEKRDGIWWVAEPFEDLAPPELMAEFLETLATLRAGRYVSKAAMKADGNVLQSYGFSEGETLRLTLEKAGTEEPMVLLVGSAAEGPNSVYCRLREPEEISGIFAVSGALRPLLEKPAQAFLAPRLIRFDPGAIQRVQIFRGETGVTVEKETATGHWKLTTPLAVRADTERVEALLNALAGASISGVASEGEADAILTEGGSAKTTIHLFRSAEENVAEITLIPGPADSDTIYARSSRRPRLYEVDPELLAAVSAQPGFWRDRRLLRLEMADVEKLTILPAENEAVTLEQLGTVWMFDAEGEKAGELVNERQVEALFTALNEAIVLGYVSDSAAEHARFGLTEPIMTWQFEGPEIGGTEEGGGRIVMKIGRQPLNNRTVFVNFEGEPFVFEVSSAFLDALSALGDEDRWRNLEVLNIAYEAMREIRIVRPEAETLRLALDFTSSASAPEKVMRLWRGDEEIGEDLDRKQASELILRLGVLEAVQWVDESTRAMDMLRRPELTLEIDYLPAKALDRAEAAGEPAVETVKLSFAPINPGVSAAYYYGRVEGKEDVFLIEDALFETLSGEGLILR